MYFISPEESKNRGPIAVMARKEDNCRYPALYLKSVMIFYVMVTRDIL
jgi:hypothetical protein